MDANRKILPRLIIHGGAWDIPKIHHRAHLSGIESALECGRKILKETDDALITVKETIMTLEKDSTFDAGTGSFLNSSGEVEMDAGIMVGADLSGGAVAAIQQVRHPIQIADLVRTETQHVLLVGEGATNFARRQGIEMVLTESLLVGREKKLYRELQAQKEVRIKSFFELKHRARDTVGVVAINSKGNLVAGTSTGGTPFKLQGRVGDSPIIGSGFYADDQAGAASSTGWGEGIMRLMLAKSATDFLRSGLSAKQAAEKSVNDLKDRVSGDGGIILIDKNGQAAYAYNTPFMAVGEATIEKILYVRI